MKGFWIEFRRVSEDLLELCSCVRSRLATAAWVTLALAREHLATRLTASGGAGDLDIPVCCRPSIPIGEFGLSGLVSHRLSSPFLSGGRTSVWNFAFELRHWGFVKCGVV